MCYCDAESTNYDVTCGIPQGSVLGPLLFIIYTNDLPNSLKNSNCILFADDTTIYQSATDITILRSQIENDMVVLNDWFYANKPSLNIQKTHFMGTQNIKRVNCAKFLGIYMCNELGGNMARFTQFPIMITRSTIIYEIISPGAAGSSIYV